MTLVLDKASSSKSRTRCLIHEIYSFVSNQNVTNLSYKSYVYWTVHHLDSWVKSNHLDTNYFIILFNAQHVSDVNTTIFRSLRLIRSYFMGCIWFRVCWRSVSVWLCWCGVFMQSEASDCSLKLHHHSHIETERQHTRNQIQPMK